ncbi:MAG: glycosyltransferase [Myxococcota bacterium]
MNRRPAPGRRLVHFYVHGRGRGHAPHAEAIIRGLVDHGYEVTVFGGADVAPLFEPMAERFVQVTPVPHRPSPRAAKIFVLRLAQAVRATWEGRPDFLISDGDHPGVIAGRLWGCPVIAVGHGLVFSRCRRPSPLPWVPWIREAVKAGASSWPATDYVPVNFVPLEAPERPDTVLARPILDDAIRRLRALSEPHPGRRVLSYFRDGNARDVLPTLKRVLQPNDQIILFSPSPDEDKNLEVDVRPLDRTAFLDLLRRVDLVVASSGSQLITECIALQRPLFALFDRDDDEQRLNVGMLQAVGAGDGCSYDQLSGPRLSRFVEDPPKGTAELWTWAAPDAAEAVLELLDRHQCKAS